MGILKEHYLNNLTEDEIDLIVEELSFHEEFIYELKDSSTYQSEEDTDKHQTYPCDS